MTLREELDKIRAGAAKRIPAEALATMHRAVEESRKEGILDRVIKVGAELPPFTLNNADGRPVISVALLAKGPIVLSFYRGKW